MSKLSRPKRRAPADESSASPADSAGIPRVAWLLIVLLALSALTIPVYRWYGSFRDDPASPDEIQQAEAPRNRLESLPTAASYPSVEELQAEAERISTALVNQYPNSASALHIAANQAAQLRQYEEASTYWQRAIELAPDFAGPYAGLAMAEMEQGNDEQAVEVLQTAIKAGFETAEIDQLLCQALQKTGDFDRAQQACRRGLERYPDDAALWLELGQLQLQLQQLEEAKTSLERSVELQPRSVPAYFSLATVVARLGDADKAAEYKARYTELKERDPLADVRFQVIYRAAVQRIVVDSLLSAAQEYLRQGDLAAAEQSLLRSLTLHPQNKEACQLLVNLYRQQGRIVDAHLVQQRLVDVQPTVENLVNLASFSLPMGRYQEAEAALTAALQLDPQSLVVHRSLVLLYQHTDQLSDARAHAEHLVRLQPDVEHYELLSQISLQMGDQAGFREASEKARRLSDTP